VGTCAANADEFFHDRQARCRGKGESLAGFGRVEDTPRNITTIVWSAVTKITKYVFFLPTYYLFIFHKLY
jgi:hypothetical protein